MLFIDWYQSTTVTNPNTTEKGINTDKGASKHPK
jgi:hypothetical protein